LPAVFGLDFELDLGLDQSQLTLVLDLNLSETVFTKFSREWGRLCNMRICFK